MGNYTAKHVTRLFDVSRETSRQWAIEFADYLSAGAQGGEGRRRDFNDDDLEVFALIHEMRKRGLQYDDVKAALDNGQRGEIPDMPTVLTAGDEKRQVLMLRQKIETLQIQRNDLKVSNSRLEGENAVLREKLDRAEQEIRDLYRQVGKLEGKLDKDD